MQIKQRLDRFINHTVTEVTIGVLIIVSIVVTVLEVTAASELARGSYARLGTAITALFIVELSIRWYVARSTALFFRQYWIDVIAVVPAVRALRILRVLRLLRLVRLGILVSRRTRKLASVLSQGLAENLLIFVVLVVVFLIGAIGITLAERQVTGGDFPDFTTAVWWSLYTLMAGEPVGGEAQTAMGRVITLVVMLGGFTLFAMFTGVVSAVMVDRLRGGIEAKEMEMEDLTGHYVIGGWNRTVPTILRELQAGPVSKATAVVIIAELDEQPPLPLEGIYPGLIFFTRGDFTSSEMLRRARVQHARGAILLADKARHRSDQDRDARTILAGLTIEKMGQHLAVEPDEGTGIYTCVELLNRDPQKVRLLESAGVEDIVEADEYIGHLMAHAARARGLVQLFDELLTATRGSRFSRELVEQPGESFGDALTRYKRERDEIPVALIRPDEDGHVDYLVNPPGDTRLGPGESLICIQPPPDRAEELWECSRMAPTRGVRRHVAGLHQLDELEDHCVICGYTRATPKILVEFRRNLHTRHMPVVVIAELKNVPAELAEVCEDGLDFFISGDFTATDVLEQARVAQAASAILLADKSRDRSDQDRDARTILAALTIEKLNCTIHTCAELLNREGEKMRMLKMAGIEDIVVGSEYVGTFIAQSSRIIGLVRVVDELLTSESGQEFYKVPIPEELVDMSMLDAIGWYKERFDGLLVGVESREAPLFGSSREPIEGNGERTWVLVNPPPQRRLGATDALFVIKSHSQVQEVYDG